MVGIFKIYLVMEVLESLAYFGWNLLFRLNISKESSEFSTNLCKAKDFHVDFEQYFTNIQSDDFLCKMQEGVEHQCHICDVQLAGAAEGDISAVSNICREKCTPLQWTKLQCTVLSCTAMYCSKVHLNLRYCSLQGTRCTKVDQLSYLFLDQVALYCTNCNGSICTGHYTKLHQVALYYCKNWTKLWCTLQATKRHQGRSTSISAPWDVSSDQGHEGYL